MGRFLLYVVLKKNPPDFPEQKYISPLRVSKKTDYSKKSEKEKIYLKKLSIVSFWKLISDYKLNWVNFFSLFLWPKAIQKLDQDMKFLPVWENHT